MVRSEELWIDIDDSSDDDQIFDSISRELISISSSLFGIEFFFCFGIAKVLY